MPTPSKYHRFLGALFLAGSVIGVSLLLGIFGYHFVARFSWIDSLLEASMILSGMGPVKNLNSNAAKVFASCYALFSGGLHLRHRHSIGAHVSSSTAPVSSRTEGPSVTIFAPVTAAVEPPAAHRELRHQVADCSVRQI